MVNSDFENLILSSLQRLEDGLRSAEEEITSNSRGAAITALQGVVEFINTVPRFDSLNLALPLSQLMSALHDLDRGRVVPMVTPSQVDNRKPEASFRKVIRAFAIFSVAELMKHGMKNEDACKFIAHNLSQTNVPIGSQRNTPDWKTIKGWRYDHTKLDADDQERNTLEALEAECRLPADMTLKQIKDHLSKQLPIVLSQAQAGLE